MLRVNKRCPNCGYEKLEYNGTSPNLNPQFRCPKCNHKFEFKQAKLEETLTIS